MDDLIVTGDDADGMTALSSGKFWDTVSKLVRGDLGYVERWCVEVRPSVRWVVTVLQNLGKITNID